MWDALRRKGVPEKIVDVIGARYKVFTCRVRVVAGVRKGCIQSPLLILIVIDEILAGAIDRDPNRGFLWQPITMEYLNDFELADGVALGHAK